MANKIIYGNKLASLRLDSFTPTDCFLYKDQLWMVVGPALPDLPGGVAVLNLSEGWRGDLDGTLFVQPVNVTIEVQ